ncbi:hypothetical protein N0V90_004648 [Kalmusia sp. IMI 367209]|nr:hypothetical protein N0V90_004648 [Kalmusia sp. IMI 367209]
MAPTKVLVTGVTGYIGGTVLNHLLNSTNPSTKNLELSVLTRNDTRADTFRSDSRIAQVHTFRDLDDSPAISAAASQNDIVIHCTSGYHPGSMKSFIRGLAQRKAAKDGREVYFIRTDGTSNLADKPISKTFTESRTFSDKDTDILTYLKNRNALDPYEQRTATIVAVETGLAEGVPTTVVMSPTIYGIGSGQFNRLTIQYPLQMRSALKEGKALYVGDGAGQWDYVHVEDLAVLYELIVLDFASGRRKVPFGERGILFSETGNFRWKEVAEGIARAGKALGVLEEAEPKSVSLEDAAQKWVDGNTQLCELAWASNSRTKAEVAYETLGWRPTKTREDWERAFQEELEEVLKNQKK